VWWSNSGCVDRCAAIATVVGMSCAALHCEVWAKLVAHVALVKMSCRLKNRKLPAVAEEKCDAR
jgi:hypothetical protein